MRKLRYSMGVSLDGFIAGSGGEIGWSAPDENLHRFHNQQTREIGAHLCGRRLYEEMLYWETAEEKPLTPEHVEFARIWRAIPKVVFSTTLEQVEGNARLARDGVADEVAKLKEQPGKDVAVGGAGLASTLMKLGLTSGCSMSPSLIQWERATSRSRPSRTTARMTQASPTWPAPVCRSTGPNSGGQARRPA